jgi:hypothetical protein
MRDVSATPREILRSIQPTDPVRLHTINPDGSPHSVPVWGDYAGAQVRMNLRATWLKGV